MPELQETAQKLQSRMLGKRLYVILTTAVAPEAEFAAALSQHLDYTIGLEKSGALFASGPFVGGEDVRPGSGLTIVRAASLDEAREIAENDPFNRQGLRRFEVREWQLNEGRYVVSVDYSDGTFRVQ